MLRSQQKGSVKFCDKFNTKGGGIKPQNDVGSKSNIFFKN